MTDHRQGDAGFFSSDACDLTAFKAVISQSLTAEDAPQAHRIEKNVPIYDMSELRPALDAVDTRQALQAEWAHVLRDRAGVIVLQNAYADLSIIDRATDVFTEIIAAESAAGAGKGDHFAKSGANDRVWNSLQKHCLHDPEGYARYFGNASIAAACAAWLGPNYQMTAQVNQVRPGGKAQQAHRDYHLGFQSADMAAEYPAHVHELSASLTLQGAISHVDMPLESGPTKLLPFSQLYAPGYLAFHRAEFSDCFEEYHIQLPLNKGDAVFFNPALLHAAGENVSTDINRMVNLLQVSSAFGRAMEQIDRFAMCKSLFPALVALKNAGQSAADLSSAIAATAEGYAFPTNLDTDPPVNGNAPPSQADILRNALAEGWTSAALGDALDALRLRQQA